ncbi:UNVERIFIED_CONTAM: bZIP transcription factor 17 [Sesamum latifolium]|uniref:BZIP transcription factor 17 n=1 Tax=Sesamum latifolium TaxID=2727402 RepID=A0AAW2XHK0_9LAMI
MVDSAVVAVDPPPPPLGGEFESSLPIPPLDATFFSENLINNDTVPRDNQNDDVVLEDLDFDFSFDDLCLPSANDFGDLLNFTQLQQSNSQSGFDRNHAQFGPSLDQLHAVFKSNSAELRHLSGGDDFSGDHSLDGSGILSSASPGWSLIRFLAISTCRRRNRMDQIAGSGNFGSNVSEDTNNCPARSVSYSPHSSNNSIRAGEVDQKIKLEESGNDNGNNSLLKRKKEGEDVMTNAESRTNKYRKSNCSAEDNDSTENNNSTNTGGWVKKKRKGRQENATLRQQMGGAAAPAAAPPPPMAPPPHGIYPHPAMMYPWMPCPPPYMMKPQGSQVPLVPIPRLKQHKPAQAPKTNKKVESKKNEGPKTKKVAGVSFLGLLFFIMLFGGLVPMVNVRYGGVREAFTGGESYIGGGFNEKHYGRVLMVNGTEYSEKHGGRRDSSSNSGVQCGQRGGGEPSADELVRLGNGSEPLAASLYVPRNDKLVKIDGNLIIHSVLASEKAMASHGKGGGETGLAVPGDLARAISVPGVGRNGARLPHLRALGSGSADKDNMQSKATEGRLQQWFREGLAGPMLSAGMCTEVFQFDVSAAIVPATATRNISEEQTKNSTRLIKGKNRRILHSVPLTDSPHNISREHTGRNSEKEGLNGNKNASSMVVSVLFDPREAGDADVDGVMGTKSLSRIFVVVLIDSVKYVTYSCMLPFKGSALHLVTA